MTPDDRFTMAERHIQEGRRILERHRTIIAERRALGLDTREAEELMATFECLLNIFDRDLGAISEWAVVMTSLR